MKEDKPKRNFTVIQAWPRLMDVETAAVYIAMSPKTLRNRICRTTEDPFEVKPIRRGRKVLFKKEELDAYADKLS